MSQDLIGGCNMALRAFVFAAIVILQMLFAATPALANYVWDDHVTMRIQNDGDVSVVDLRTHYGMSPERPRVMEWGLVGPGASFGDGTYAGLTVEEVGANGDVVPYRQVKDVENLKAGDYAIVEDEGRTSVTLYPKNPDDGDATFRASYYLTGAVRRWSDAGGVQLRLWSPAQKLSETASFELLFPNDKDGRPADTPTDLQTWEHTIMDWKDEDETYAIVAIESNGTYRAQGGAYLVDGIDKEVRALFPARLLYEMDPLPQSQGKEMRAQEEAAAEAFGKKHEEELRMQTQAIEAEKLAREQRLSVEVPFYLVSSIGMGAYCIYRARRIRRAYDKTHLQHVTNAWYRQMFAKYQSRHKGDEPEAEGVGDAMLSDDVHPLVVGWALSGGSLAYSAIAATLARLSPLGVVEIAPVYTPKTKWDDEIALSSPVKSIGNQDEWMLVFHRERFGLVGDPLDRKVLDLFETFLDTVSRRTSISSERSFVSTYQGECLLLSDLRRMVTWPGNTYLKQLKELKATIREVCHEQGLDDDQETVGQRTHLKMLGFLYACVLVMGTAALMVDRSAAIIACPIIGVIVFPYLLDSHRLIAPLSKRAVQLRSELGRMRLWLHDLDSSCDEASEGFDIQTWQLVLARALVLGEDGKAADRVWRNASSYVQKPGVSAMLNWCDKPSWGVVWAFEDATRSAMTVRGIKPSPIPSY